MFPTFVGHTGNVNSQVRLWGIVERRYDSQKLRYGDFAVSFRTQPDAYRNKWNIHLAKVSPIWPWSFKYSGKWPRNFHTGNVDIQVILWGIGKPRSDSHIIRYDDCTESFRTQPDAYHDKWNVYLPKVSLRLVERTRPYIDGNLSDLPHLADDFHTDVSRIWRGRKWLRRFI